MCGELEYRRVLPESTLKLADRFRSLVIGAGIESVLVGIIYWLHELLHLRPLPLHPVTLLSFLSQLPGVLAAIPFVIVEQSASEQMADMLELVGLWAVVVAQALFFAAIHYNFHDRRSTESQ